MDVVGDVFICIAMVFIQVFVESTARRLWIERYLVF